MNRACGKWLVVAALLGGAGAKAADPAPPPTGAALPVGARSAEAGKSPVDTFRELLAMPPGERKDFLADRPPEAQRQILAKVREYSAMRPNERDVRLEVTELYYYLTPLMKTPATNRAAQLALVPERERPKVEARLREWDRLPTARQQELLTNALIVRHYIDIQTQPPTPLFPPAREEQLERGIQQWRALPPDRRQQITARFNQFFDLTDTEKQKALNTLSEAERGQIQKTLNKFSRLTPAERDEYLQGLDKFAQLNAAERQQFLKKAERWSALSADERQEWRQAVEDIVRMPPVPPGAVPPLPGEGD